MFRRVGFQYGDNVLDVFALDRLALGEQVRVLGKERNEINFEPTSGCFDSETNVSHAAGDSGCHRKVRELLRVVAADLALIDARNGQHPIKSEVRSRTALPVDKPRFGPGNVGEAQDSERVTRSNDQPLRPTHEANQALNPRIEPGFVFRKDLLPE
jgi:hypothetical protein